MKRFFDPDLIIVNPDLSLWEGALALANRRRSPYTRQLIAAVCRTTA